MPISWTDANILMIGSSTGGETFVLVALFMASTVWRFPPIGDKVQHQREHGQGRRTVSAEDSGTVQCMGGAASAAKSAVPRLVWPKSVAAVETAILQTPVRGGDPMCINLAARSGKECPERIFSGCPYGDTTTRVSGRRN